MAVSEKLKALVDQMPNPDGRGMFTENIDKEKIDKAIALIHEGGRENIEGLIEMLGEPGTKENVKPHYALHCLANHVPDHPGRKRPAAVLPDRGGKIGQRSAGLTPNLPVPDASVGGPQGGCCRRWASCCWTNNWSKPASMALTAIRDGAAEQFRAALPQADGQVPLNVVQGLGAVEDRQSADALRQATRRFGSRSADRRRAGACPAWAMPVRSTC
jgi:hypothetical protein